MERAVFCSASSCNSVKNTVMRSVSLTARLLFSNSSTEPFFCEISESSRFQKPYLGSKKNKQTTIWMETNIRTTREKLNSKTAVLVQWALSAFVHAQRKRSQNYGETMEWAVFCRASNCNSVKKTGLCVLCLWPPDYYFQIVQPNNFFCELNYELSYDKRTRTKLFKITH